MKTRWKIITGIAVIIAAAVIISSVTKTPEPSYGGKSLSQWLSVYAEERKNPKQDFEIKDATTNALRSMSTNALPSIVDWVDHKGPAFTFATAVANAINWVMVKTGRDDGGTYFILANDWRASAAVTAFSILSTNALSAIPILSNRVVNAREIHPVVNDFIALEQIGPSGIQTALFILQNAPKTNRPAIFALLGWCPPEQVPTARAGASNYLADPDPQMRDIATNLLQTLGTTNRFMSAY